jgi:hypothetical protein
LKFSKHPQLLFQLISYKNWHQGICQRQISFRTAFFVLKNSLDANFCWKGAETKVGSVLKTLRHFWTHGVINFYIYPGMFEIIDTEVGQFSSFLKNIEVKNPLVVNFLSESIHYPILAMGT